MRDTILSLCLGRKRRAEREYRAELAAEVFRKVDAIRVVELRPGESVPGWPREDVIYTEVRMVKQRNTIVGLERDLVGARQSVAVSEAARARVGVRVSDLERKVTTLVHQVAMLECDHHRKRTRVYAGHAWQGNVAHLVQVECLDCGKILREELHAVEITGI